MKGKQLHSLGYKIDEDYDSQPPQHPFRPCPFYKEHKPVNDKCNNEDVNQIYEPAKIKDKLRHKSPKYRSPCPLSVTVKKLNNTDTEHGHGSRSFYNVYHIHCHACFFYIMNPYNTCPAQYSCCNSSDAALKSAFCIKPKNLAYKGFSGCSEKYRPSEGLKFRQPVYNLQVIFSAFAKTYARVNCNPLFFNTRLYGKSNPFFQMIEDILHKVMIVDVCLHGCRGSSHM